MWHSSIFSCGYYKFTDYRGKQHLAASHRQLTGYLMDTHGNILRKLSSGKVDKVSEGEGGRGGRGGSGGNCIFLQNMYFLAVM